MEVTTTFGHDGGNDDDNNGDDNGDGDVDDCVNNDDNDDDNFWQGRNGQTDAQTCARQARLHPSRSFNFNLQNEAA